MTSTGAHTGGERRRVTVLFCDLVGSTHLSDALDPEDYSDVMHTYYDSCGRVVDGLGGWIADYLGDGLVVYFGYPDSHEDDPMRAVRAGLGLVKAVGDLGTQLSSLGVDLTCRVGIETGLVVVGESRGAESREPIWALGRTVNLASRLQTIAAPGEVVIGEGTCALVEGWFHLESLGEHVIKGIAKPLEVFHVILETAAKDRLHAALPRGLAPMANRIEQMNLLRAAWDRAADGRGGAVVLRGEAGIGKSRLALSLLEDLRPTGATLVDLYCSQDEAASPLRPVLEHLQRRMGLSSDDPPEERLARLGARLERAALEDPDALPLLAEILIPEIASPVDALPEERRRRAMELFVRLLLPHGPPTLILVEDLHWADPSTAELVAMVIERIPAARGLVVLTARPEFDASWIALPHVTLVDIPRLDASYTAELAASVAGAHLPREAQALIRARTDGVPLFVEELTRMVLDSGLVSVEEGRAVMRGRLEGQEVPGSVYDLMVARLGRLGPEVALAQLAAVLGNEFSGDFLRAVAGEVGVDAELAKLVDAGVVHRRGGDDETFRFSHSLVRDAAYGLMLRKRRRELHGRVADVLARDFPDAVATRPELAAPHFSESGRVAEAIDHWVRASHRASEQHALHEAIDHRQRALDLVRTLPGSPERARQEIEILFALGPLIQNASGFGDPRVGEIHARVGELSHWLESDSERFTYLAYGFAVQIVLANYEAARETAGRLVEIAERGPSHTRQLLAHCSRGTILFQLGEFSSSLPSILRCIELYDPDRHEGLITSAGIDPGLVAWGYRAWIEWHLGLADSAKRTAQDMLRLSEAHPHPFRSATAKVWAAGLAQRLRVSATTAREADEAVAIAREHGYEELERYAMCLSGWAAAAAGRPEEGVAAIRDGLALVPHGGSRAHLSWQLSMLAEAELEAGHHDQALEALAKAMEFAEATGERVFTPELHRLKGEIAQREAAPAEDVATEFRAAAEAARGQGSRPFELRALAALYRLRPDDVARAALESCRATFTEGFDTPELIESGVLLETGR